MYQIDKLMELSINERQCIAAICMKEYCIKNDIYHPDIDEYVDHVWKISQVDRNNFAEWSNHFNQLVITGQGDSYSESLLASIPDNLLNEFEKLSQYVYEISAVCWYSCERKVSGEILIKIFNIIESYGIIIPKYLSLIKGDKNDNGWSPAISDDELKKLRYEFK